MRANSTSYSEKFTEQLDAYARLVVRVGVHLQAGQPLIINAPIECADFARRLARESYTAGAADVTVVWSDERMARIRYEMAPEAALSSFPAWKKQLYESLTDEGAAVISIHAEDPEAFSGIAPARLKMSQQAAGEALLEYRTRLMANRNRWCVVSVPTVAWAKKVFPQLTADDAVAHLWKKILAAVRVDFGDPVARWEAHIAFLQRAATFMNVQAFTALHYKNALGTDLTVRLPEGHIWTGGAEIAGDGVRFAANLPTEEVYTAPMRTGVDGVVYATKPLVYGGNLISEMKLVFEGGVVVDFDASAGKDVLAELLTTDEGARRLGEIALVPYDSPISTSGVLFYNGLFDENSSCHLALGKAYSISIAGGADADSVTLLARGLNDSLVHEDFMIGSRDLSIDGVKADGTVVPVFRDGNFVPFD